MKLDVWVGRFHMFHKLLFATVFALCGFVRANGSYAEDGRIALLIGNQSYQESVGPLFNPHNDVEHVGASLKKLGFNTEIIKDVDFGDLLKAVKRYTVRLRNAGEGAIGFFYYSGHGASNARTSTNYIIPVDVTSGESEELWINSVQLKRVINDLKDRASNATHFVVFDACRNQLKFKQKGSKWISRPKGFAPVRKVHGMLIAYATADGEVASDVGNRVGPYAEALAAELQQPGVEAVHMFRNVQIRVARAIGQNPWLNYGTMPEIFFGGREKPDVAEWNKIKDQPSIEAFKHFVKRFPNGVYSDFATMQLAILKEEENHRREIKAWNAARKSNKADQLGAFIRNYPDSVYVSLVTEQLEKLTREEPQKHKPITLPKPPVSRAAEAWAAIKDSTSPAVFEVYMKRFPDSLYADFAKARLKELEAAPSKPTKKERATNTKKKKIKNARSSRYARSSRLKRRRRPSPSGSRSPRSSGSRGMILP